MKKIKMLTFAAFAATAAISFAGCGSADTTDTTKEETQSTDTTQESTSGESTSTESTGSETEGTDTQESTESVDTSNVDFNKPDVTIKDGEFEAMKTLASDISEGKMAGKVVEIEGYHSNNIRHSIMEGDGNGAGVGFEFEVEGFAEEDYPAHEAKIKITGVVRETGEEALGMKVYKIYVPKDNFKVL